MKRILRAVATIGVAAAAITVGQGIAAADVLNPGYNPLFLGNDVKLYGNTGQCQAIANIRFETDRAKPGIVTFVLQPRDARGSGPDWDRDRTCTLPVTLAVADYAEHFVTPLVQNVQFTVGEGPQPPARFDVAAGYGLKFFSVGSNPGVPSAGGLGDVLAPPLSTQTLLTINVP